MQTRKATGLGEAWKRYDDALIERWKPHGPEDEERLCNELREAQRRYEELKGE